LKRRIAAFSVLLMALSAPSIAHAHLVNSGLGPFYDGALHLFLSPMDIVRLVTLSLFAGAQAPGTGRSVVIATPAAWFLGATASLAPNAPDAFAVANAVSLFLLGAVVTLDLRVPAAIAAVLAVGFGGLLGFQSGVELRTDNADWAALVGATAIVLAILLLATSFVASIKSFAMRVACRVLGSWAAATGLLSIGWVIAANR